MDQKKRYLLRGPVDLETINSVCLLNGDFERISVECRGQFVAVTAFVSKHLNDVSDQAFSNLQIAFDVADLEWSVDSNQSETPPHKQPRPRMLHDFRIPESCATDLQLMYIWQEALGRFRNLISANKLRSSMIWFQSLLDNELDAQNCADEDNL